MVGALLMATAGCTAQEDASRGEPESHSYGRELTAVAETDSTTTGPPSTVPTTTGVSPGAGTAPAQATSTSRVANRADRLDESGLFLSVVAADGVEFRVTDRVTFELAFENRSDHMVYLDSNQELRFVLYRMGGSTPEPAWTNLECRASMGPIDSEKPRTGLLQFPPKETGRFVDDYPVKPTSEHGYGPDPDSCRVAPGRYAIVGVVDTCPPEAMKRSEFNDQPYCDASGVRHTQSAPLELTFKD